MKIQILTFIIAFIFFFDQLFSQNIVRNQNTPTKVAQSKSNSIRPKGVSLGYTEKTKSQVIIADVPAYVWRHGCGPTAVGMVVGYYDLHGFDQLISGVATSQTSNVNDAIANSFHYDDYSLPMDDYPQLFQDKSELGGAHVSNCIADFMKTSWSSEENRYGWSWDSDIGPAFKSFVNQQINGANPTFAKIYYSSTSWNVYKTEINANRPVVLLVDSDGDGYTDHFVTGIGYDESNNTYGIYDTWDKQIHWFVWRQMSNTYTWGVYNFHSFHLSGGSELPNLVPYQPITSSYSWQDKIILKNDTISGAEQNLQDDIITDENDIFVALAYENSSEYDISTPFIVKIFVDDNEKLSLTHTEVFQSHYFSMWCNWNIGKLTAGEHQIEMKTDYFNAIEESNELDNAYSKIFIVQQSSIIKNQSNDFLRIFPNPVVDVVNIETNYPINVVNIYDLSGKLHVQKEINNNQIDLSSLPSGVYFIHFSTKAYEKISIIVKH